MPDYAHTRRKTQFFFLAQALYNDLRCLDLGIMALLLVLCMLEDDSRGEIDEGDVVREAELLRGLLAA